MGEVASGLSCCGFRCVRKPSDRLDIHRARGCDQSSAEVVTCWLFWLPQRPSVLQRNVNKERKKDRKASQIQEEIHQWRLFLLRL